MVVPSLRFSKSETTGTRVPENTKAPLTFSGSRSTAGTALPGAHRVTSFTASGFSRFRIHLSMDCIVHVLFRKWIHFRQLGRGSPHVELAGDDVGDQPGTVFVE